MTEELTAIGWLNSILVPDVIGPDQAWRREYMPDDLTLPAITYSEIDRTAVLSGDGQVCGWRDTEQVDLWQEVGKEDLWLVDRVIDAINGRNLGGRFYRSRVEQVVRIPEDSIVHHAITVTIGYAHVPSLPNVHLVNGYPAGRLEPEDDAVE